MDDQPSQALPAYTAIVLAGGQGSRMQGQDKGLVPFGSRRLIDHALARLTGQHHQPQNILISANRNTSTYAQLGYPVLADTVADYPGPLAGFLAGMVACQSSWLLSVPCDSPYFPLDLSQRLLMQAQQDQVDIVIAANRDEEGHQRRQPVFCLMRPQLASDLLTFIQAGEGKIGAWIHRHAFSVVCFDQAQDDRSAFFNVNSAAELELPSPR